MKLNRFGDLNEGAVKHAIMQIADKVMPEINMDGLKSAADKRKFVEDEVGRIYNKYDGMDDYIVDEIMYRLELDETQRYYGKGKNTAAKPKKEEEIEEAQRYYGKKKEDDVVSKNAGTNKIKQFGDFDGLKTKVKTDKKKQAKPGVQKYIKVNQKYVPIDEARKNYDRTGFSKYPYQMYFSDHNMADAVGADSIKELVDNVAKKRGIKAFAIFKNGSGFNSTTQDEFLVKWYDEDDNSYWANRSKKEPALDKKRLTSLTGNLKLQESEVDESAYNDYAKLAPAMKEAFSKYLKDKKLVSLVSSLKSVERQAKKISDNGSGKAGMWWRFFEDDTLANTISSLKTALELPDSHGNHKHAIECMELAADPKTKIKIYYS